MKKNKLGKILIIIGLIIIVFSLTLRMEKTVCCSEFAGVRLGSAVDIWRSNMWDMNCVCFPENISPGVIVEPLEPVPNYYYIPIELLIVGIIIVFIGLYKNRNTKKIKENKESQF